MCLIPSTGAHYVPSDRCFLHEQMERDLERSVDLSLELKDHKLSSIFSLKLTSFQYETCGGRFGHISDARQLLAFGRELTCMFIFTPNSIYIRLFCAPYSRLDGLFIFDL